MPLIDVNFSPLERENVGSFSYIFQINSDFFPAILKLSFFLSLSHSLSPEIEVICKDQIEFLVSQTCEDEMRKKRIHRATRFPGKLHGINTKAK